MKGNKAWLLKADTEKAYCKLEWTLLFSTLQSLGFHNNGLNRSKNVSQWFSISIIISNDVCGFFRPTRSIYQGNCLSSFLFTINREIPNKGPSDGTLQKETSDWYMTSKLCHYWVISNKQIMSLLSNFYHKSTNWPIFINHHLLFWKMHLYMTDKLCHPFSILRKNLGKCLCNSPKI